MLLHMSWGRVTSFSFAFYSFSKLLNFRHSNPKLRKRWSWQHRLFNPKKSACQSVIFISADSSEHYCIHMPLHDWEDFCTAEFSCVCSVIDWCRHLNLHLTSGLRFCFWRCYTISALTLLTSDISETHLSTTLKSTVCIEQMNHLPEKRARKTKKQTCWLSIASAEECTPAVRQHQSVE